MSVVGFLGPALNARQHWLAAFRAGLTGEGFVEGPNVTLESEGFVEGPNVTLE